MSIFSQISSELVNFIAVKSLAESEKMSASSKFACSLCETSYVIEARLKVHKEEDHAEEMLFCCLARHSCLVHEVSPPSSPRAPWSSPGRAWLALSAVGESRGSLEVTL